jgi:hypothetical protein
VVQTGTEFRLALTGSTLLAPADSLPPGVNVTLAAVNPVHLDPPPNDFSEEVFTQVFELEFSKIVPARKPITLELQIPTFVQARFYILVRVEGGMRFHGPPDSDWLVDIGTYDPVRLRLSITFFATARKISVVVVRNRKEAAAGGGTTCAVEPPPTQTTASARPVQELTSWIWVVKEAAAANGSMTADPSVHALTSRGWILICRKGAFPR